MASACVNNIGMSPESFLDCPPSTNYPSYGWLSPRISFSRDVANEEKASSSKGVINNMPQPPPPQAPVEEKATSVAETVKEEPDPEVALANDNMVDFEFRLEDPVTMLPADELFSDGKLVPLHLSTIRPTTTAVDSAPSSEVRSPDTPKFRRRNEILTNDPYLFSPKAPRCSSRWKELLGLKKLYQNSTNNANNNGKQESNKNATTHHKSIKSFLQRNSRSSNSSVDSSSLSLPLLKDLDNDSSVSLSSSRLSLSSSSSGHEHDDLPRLSLDSDTKPTLSHTHNSINLTFSSSAQNRSNTNGPRRVRVVKTRGASSDNPTTTASRVGRSTMRRSTAGGGESTASTSGNTVLGVTVDSPRMNSSGKIVFHSLERSSSSPSSYGGPRYKHRGMERSYSANVRVTPVLNVPVCSLRGSSKSGGVFGFPLFSSSSSSQQKKDNGGNGGSLKKENGGGSGSHRGQQQSSSSRNRTTDRT